MTDTHKAILGFVVTALAVLKAYDYVRSCGRCIASIGIGTYTMLTQLCKGIARHWRAYATAREQRAAKRLEGLTAAQVDTTQNLAGVVASQHDLLLATNGAKRPTKPSAADIKTHHRLAEVVASQHEQLTALQNELAREREEHLIALALARQEIL